VTFRAVVISFLIGIVLGIAGTISGPEWVAPYLPESFRNEMAPIEGTVVTKRREGDQIRLMLQTAEGSIVASFKEKVSEIELLVSEGDRVTLLLKEYKPFVDDPAIGRVRTETEPQHEAEPPASSQEKEPVVQ
jgi:hypothetical protein